MFPYKDDNPAKAFPLITISIIVINIIVFIWEVFSPKGMQAIVLTYGAVPATILFQNGPLAVGKSQILHPILTVFTSMFMHAGLFHIAGNMLYLWIFGNNIENKLGHFRFLIFYLLCGVVATYSHAITTPYSTVPGIGASGAIAGVLGAYVLLFPYAKIHTLIFLGFFITVVKIPALIVIGFWFVIQIVNGIVSQNFVMGNKIAWFAHIGGFLTGILTVKLWLPKKEKN